MADCINRVGGFRSAKDAAADCKPRRDKKLQTVPQQGIASSAAAKKQKDKTVFKLEG